MPSSWWRCMKPMAYQAKPCKTWCRENGLFTHHLTSWKTAFCTDVKTVMGSCEIRVLEDENGRLKRELIRKEHALTEAAALLILKKIPRALGGRGQMTSLAERSQIITLVQEAMNSGARQNRACTVINFNARTLRWQVDQSRGDAPVGHKHRQTSSVCGSVNTY